MENSPLKIAISDDSRGYEIEPRRIPLAVLREFTRDVEEFLKGDSKQVDTDTIEVKIVEGSFALETTDPILSSELVGDLNKLLDIQLIDFLGKKRREVIARWQKAAKGPRKIKVAITSQLLFRPIIIDETTDYRADDADQWVAVERYLRGEIFDIGGKNTVNAHMNLPDGKTITVEADRDAIKNDKFNRLYKPAMVRIKAEYNVVTREYRAAKLIEFVEHDTRFDETAFARLTERGSIAWKDIASASDWIDAIRGASN